MTIDEFALRTVASRLAGERVSRPRALLSASVVALGAGLTVYRLLRTGAASGP